MDELEQLIERVKAATGPDRELDFDFARFEGWTQHSDEDDPVYVGRVSMWWAEPGDEWSTSSNPPLYTASIDAALALTERVLPKFVIYSFGNGDLDLRYSDIRAFVGWRCGLAPVGFSIKENPIDLLMWPSAHAPTAPLAILAATLSALQSMETKNA